jgi:hypothetical protein
MEDQRFDELTKTFAKPVSRRQMVKVLVATTVGGIFARSGTGKAFATSTCTPNNTCAQFCTTVFGGDTASQSACAMEATKCQGLCWTCGPGANPSHLTPCPGGTLPGTSFPGHCANLQTDNKNCGACNHVCPSGQFCCGGQCIANCAPPDQCHQPGVCNSSAHSCVYANKTNGTTCTGTNKCFLTYTCQAGVCTASNPVTCTALDQCHQAGTCDPTTGVCSSPTQPNGTACTGTDRCFQTYTCQSGVCTGSNRVFCPACQVCSGGTCVADTSANGTFCGTGLVCQNGSCVACGDNGQPCCAGGNCAGGRVCCNGICCPNTAPLCCNGACQATPC